MPSSPGPTWAPSTAPISETKAGSQPKISRPSSISAVGGLEVLDVLDDPGVEAVLVALAGVVAQPLDRAVAGPDPLDRGDLLLEGEDRLDLQRRADPGARAADPAAAPQVLEGVDREPHLQLLARLLGPGDDGVAVGPRRAPRRRRRATQRPIPPAAERESKTWIRSPPLPSSISRSRAWIGRLEGAGDAGRDVDRDDLATGVEQRLVDGDEVADRGLRGGRAALGGAQPLVEVGEVGDLGLGLLAVVDRDVEADPLDVPLGDEVRRAGRPWCRRRRRFARSGSRRAILSDLSLHFVK